MTRHSRIAVWLARLAPRRLGARFAWTVLLTNLAAVTVAVGLMLVSVSFIVPRIGEASAERVLESIDQAIREQARSADVAVATLALSPQVADACRAGVVSDDVRSALDTFANDMGAAAFVFLDSAHEPLYASGSEADASLLVSLVARDHDLEDAAGPIAFDGGLALVATAALGGPQADSCGGHLAIAVPFRADDVASTGVITIDDPEGISAESRQGHQIDSSLFDDVWVSTSGSTLNVEAEIPGRDGRPAGTALYTGRLAIGAAMSGVALWAVGAGALASLVGLGVGLAVARAIVRPVESLTDLMARRAVDTITGRPSVAVEHDPSLPSELSDLIDVFNAAFEDLGQHQAALAHAKEEAVAARAGLDIAFVDSLDGKILVTEGAVTLINPAACSHLGIGAGEALGVPPEEFLSTAELLTNSEEPVDPQRLLEESQHASVTVQRRPAGLSTRWIEVHAAPHDQDPSTLLISTRDVTEERRVDELRSEIMGLVTHDLRAPLTVITGYLELLDRDLDEHARSNAIESARRSAARMRDLLEDLLAATRAEEMFAPTELAQVSLRDIAEETVVSFEHTSAHPLRLEASCPGEVLGEEKRLRQVLVNLVTNALKYSPEDSPVDVSVACSEGAVTLAVEDRGAGVKESERNVVFERFTRLPDQEGGRKPGVGLGLYIVKVIVESHGGSVVVTDRLDGESGARFVVTLPHAPVTGG